MIRRLISVLGGVAIGLSASQFPEFAQQYEQRLGGAVAELRVIAEKFDAAAARAGLSRQEALGTYRETDIAFLAGQGEDIGSTLARYERLETQLDALENANIVTRVTGFARYYDPEIGASALEAYNPAVPVTTEGFAYAGIGVLVGYALFGLLGWAGARPFRRRRSRVRVERDT
ncbi:MAG: DUF2937 family protein [Alphaproteobacteria bacterium]|nr:DUF2937 family protein [Alphaproteobacteria bacterium]